MNQQYDLTIQRQINNKMSVEVGYIGRHITHEFQPINVNAVPYMMTVGGQRFDKAYGQMVLQYCGGNAGMAGGNCAANLAAVTAQPFFEAAINPSYCTACFANCTQAVASKEAGNIPDGQCLEPMERSGWRHTSRRPSPGSLWSDLADRCFNFPAP